MGGRQEGQERPAEDHSSGETIEPSSQGQGCGCAPPLSAWNRLVSNVSLARKAGQAWTDRHWDKSELRGAVPEDEGARLKGVHAETHMLTMRDGVRIAVDVMLPPGTEPGQKVPCVLHQTRYYRQWRLRNLLRAVESFPMDPINLSFKKAFVASGFAVVSVDVRGTGASFGQWSAPCSAAERGDSAEVVHWLASQSWCNGSVYLYGISYDGMCALFTAACGDLAIKACAPLYAFWDIYADMGAPGGVLLHFFFDNWNRIVHSLDTGRLIEAPSPIGEAFVAGFKGAKGESKTLLRQAIEDHDSVNLSRALRQIDFRDDVAEAFTEDVDHTSSPFLAAEAIRKSGVPLFAVAGWLDGSARSSISMWCHVARHQPTSRLLIGPWTHGGVQHGGIGPKLKSRFSRFHKIVRTGSSKLVAEIVRYFKFLEGETLPVGQRKGVTYYLMNSPRTHEPWRHVNAWPPPHLQGDKVFHLDFSGKPPRAHAHGRLAAAPPDPEQLSGRVSFDVRAQKAPQGVSRFRAMLFVGDLMSYPSLDALGHIVLDSPPLEHHMEVTGTPWVELCLSSSDTDADVIVYLENYDPKTKHTNYVTEGVFRAVHRKARDASECRSHLREGLAPDVPFYHSYLAEDSEPLKPGVPASVKFELFPTSYCFQKGTCVRLAISGQDEQHYVHKLPPESRQIALYSGRMPACLHLPHRTFQ